MPSYKPERPPREQEQQEDMASEDDMGLSPLEMEMFLLQEEEGTDELQDGRDIDSGPSHSIMRALATDLAAPRVVAEAVDAVAAAVCSALSVLKTTKSLESLAKVLAARHSMTVTLRAGLGTSSVAACTSQLRHRFLMVQLHPGGPHVFVDPTFREQFRLGTSLRSYEAMLDASVPAVFVGSRAALDATVLAICYKMQRALKKLHLEVPPWRAASAVVSKWSPGRHADTLYHPAPGGGLFGSSGRQPRNGDVQHSSSGKPASVVAERAGAAVTAAVLAGSPVFHGGRPSASLLSEAFRVIPPRQAEAAAAAAAVKNDAAPKSVVYGFSITRPASGKPTAAAAATQAPFTPVTVTAPAASAASTSHAPPSERSPPPPEEEAAPATADVDLKQGADQSKPGQGQFRTLDDLLPAIRTVKLGP